LCEEKDLMQHSKTLYLSHTLRDRATRKTREILLWGGQRDSTYERSGSRQTTDEFGAENREVRLARGGNSRKKHSWPTLAGAIFDGGPLKRPSCAKRREW